MASYNNVRHIGLELEEQVAALKTAIDAIDTAMSAWELRGLDTALPTEVEVATQLAAYDAISKPSLSLNDDLSAVRAVDLS
ncbi:MAG: hypothetical protein PVH19_00100 [Planctomycetia bacterium]|jgi:hypothetical protein